MSSNGLEMPVTESDKLELPVLGCRFGEKTEHLPIKKRRFLFRTPSPPHNTASIEETASVATCLNSSSSQEVEPKPVADTCQNGSIGNKVHEEKFVKAIDDMCGISLGCSGIGSYGIKSLAAPATVKLEANTVNLPNISGKETGLLIIPTVPFKDGVTVDNNTQVTSEGNKSGVCDERLNWDLNTVMAWEESPECDHTTYPEGIKSCKEGNSKACKQEQHCGSASESENTGNKILTNLTTNLGHKIHGQESVSNEINKLSFPVISSNIRPPTKAVPGIVKLEYPPCDISTKHCKNGNNLAYSPMPAGIGLSLGFDHMRCSEENVGTSTNIGTGVVLQTSAENENLNLSVGSVASLENEDDKAKVKRVITMENLGTRKDAYKAVNNQSTIGSLLGIQSSVSPELGHEHHQPCVVSDAPIKPEKSPPPCVSYDNKEVCQVALENGFGYENLPISDIQGSEVDNAEEFSIGFDDSQFEDGEVRESSIQTWEGSEGDNRENEHATEENNNNTCGSHECAPESSSRIRSSEMGGSQKGTDEISSVLLPEEKPEVSNSQPNETNTRQVSMKDESESDQWKMNVSGSETLLPSDDYTSKMKDIKLYKRETSTSTRDVFINRGSRFRMQQGYSSSNGGDDSGSRSRELRPFRRGKYSPHVRTSNRGGATWNRSPVRDRDPPFFRDVDSLTNEAYDDVIRPYVPHRQSFRTRLVGNREEDDFRARLGLRPAGDTCHTTTRFVGRGRYGSRGGGRYGGPANDDGYNNEPLEYPHSFPRRRCFSPTERRENHPCVHHHSGSTSPPRSRTRSRSPRIRRPRSPGYHRFEAAGGIGYNNNNNLEGRNNDSPPGTRWVKYKQRSTAAVFHRSPPPPPPIGERLSFYDSARKTKQCENYRAGRYSEVMDHGYNSRHGGGGFVKRHEMGGSRPPVKQQQHMVEYGEEENGYGMEFHGRGNPKAYNSNGTEPRFRDHLSRRGNPRGEKRDMSSKDE